MRLRARVTDRMATTQIHLHPRPPFKLSSVIQSHGWVQLAPFESDEHRHDLTYLDRLPSGLVVHYHVRRPSDRPADMEPEDVLVTATADPRPTAAEKTEISRRVRWMLDLALDLDEFYESARQEPKLAGVEGARVLALGLGLSEAGSSADLMARIVSAAVASSTMP